MKKTSVSVKDILAVLELSPACVRGDLSRRVNSVAPIEQAKSSQQITFCAPEKKEGGRLVRESKAGIIVCPENLDIDGVDLKSKTLIRIVDPRRAFIRIMERYFAPERPQGVHETAVVHESARLGDRVYIGPNCVVGEKVEIGDDSVLFGQVYIYGPSSIGKRCIIHSGAVLGADGFGFWRNEKGGLDKFPQVGEILVGDDVEIGANTTIDRGTLGRTTIGSATKIDNLVHIAHNVEVGEHCFLAAGSVVCGSVKIGAGSWIAPRACILDRVEIGKKVTIGLGAVVADSVPDNDTVISPPARRVKGASREREDVAEGALAFSADLSRDDLESVVIACLREVLLQKGESSPDSINDSTPLLGSQSVFDSLGLVTLIVDIEQQLNQKYGVSLSLADDKAMSLKQSPFRTVRTLVDYICFLAGAKSGR